jgi:arsenate reductase
MQWAEGRFKFNRLGFRSSASIRPEDPLRENFMDDPLKVLIICRHNSGRSQIAEAYLKRLAGSRVEVESAGLEPASAVNPLVVEVMKEDGFDLSAKRPQSVFELFKQGRLFDHVITVCSDTEHQCPLFPGITRRWHMPFPDPSTVTGTPEEQIAQVRKIRDMIKTWLSRPGQGDFVAKARLLG